MRDAIIKIHILAMFIVGVAGVAHASNYKDAYKAYNVALKNGNVTEAIKYAKEAWREAEQEIGDNNSTAVLAYNYADLIYASDPSSAIEPLERVIALTGEANEMFGAEAPIIMLRYAELIQGEKTKAQQDSLRKLVSNWRKNELPFSLVAGRSWYELCSILVKKRNHNRAANYCHYAYENFVGVDAVESREYINVLILNGIARISGGNRSPRDIEFAYEFFGAAVSFFPPQESIETIDPALAFVYTWFLAAEAAALTDSDNNAYPGPTRLRVQSPKLPNEKPEIKFIGDDKESCSWKWDDDRKQVKFPYGDGNKGYIGAVLLGYHLDEAGKVAGAKILAEVPIVSDFAETVLDTVQGWSVKGSIVPPEKCRKNLLLDVKFVGAN